MAGPVLTGDQWKQFQLFGYLVLRQWLSATEVGEVRAEVDRELQVAFGDRLEERTYFGGIEGYYLPMLRAATPTSCRLVEDDRFAGAAEELLDGRTIVSPVAVEAVLYYHEAGWHTDDGYGVSGVKFVAYLDAVTAATGALRVLPLSHRIDQQILRPWLQHPRVPIEGVPGQILDTEPGDVIAFDLHTFHANAGGADRRQWTATFVRDPKDSADEEAVRGLLGEGPSWEGNPFPPGYPWLDPAWVHDPEPSRRKRQWLQRLAALTDAPCLSNYRGEPAEPGGRVVRPNLG